MQIADRLKQRYADNMKFIGFDSETYSRTLSNVDLQESRLNKLNSLKSVELVSLSYDLKKIKKAAYEEDNIDYIVDFIESDLK